MMNENINRIISGWRPRQDAPFYYWMVSDVIGICSIIKHKIIMIKDKRKG